MTRHRGAGLLALGTLLAVLPSRPLAAQDSPAADTTAGAEYRISVLTAGAGAEVWERFGHNMIRVQNSATGEDVAYNWGMFSFRQENFIGRFLMGRMKYWMQGIPMGVIFRQYTHADRTLIDQRLTLTPAERVALVRFLEWNAREENKYYRYDYYLDNCSTRLRDALDRVLGGAIQAGTGSAPSGTTFRQETRRLTVGDLPLYTGLMLGLGPPTDRPISQWEEMFLPVRMMVRLRGVQVRDSAGLPAPLVASEDTLYLSGRYTEPAGGARRVPLYAGIGLGVGLLLLLAGRARRPRLFLALGGLVALVVGLGGALLTFLMGFTDHAVTYGNENALLVSFLALVLAFVLRPATHGAPRAGTLASGLAVAVMGLAVVALLLKVILPGHQDTWETLALMLPIDLGLGFGTLYAVSGPTWRPPKAG
ncbi:MAG TPA: DUF4105 domain-containing protein, partial [Gemmatimonadales bacterium]|nr:DUF4105 domain-containing protein [Gemmatimonadales bacterium]